jgi:adenylate cyclase
VDKDTSVDRDTVDTFIRYEVEGHHYEIPIERLRICGFGRSMSNAVVLTDSMASREHAMIRRNATGHCVLNDLGSTNGTWLNGRVITTPMLLNSGDVIQIGRHTIDFVQTAKPNTMLEPAPGQTQFLVEQQLVSALVIDMRNYTGMSTAMGPERTAAMMGEIFREAGDLLRQANCWSSKYIGDAIMALWVHPGNSLARADIVQALDLISAYQGIFRVAERKYQPPQPLRFGCGFNAGTASIGNIGSAGAADFTAMGEAVNTAFRLETATKESGYDLFIARAVFDALSDTYFQPPGMIDVEVKGYDRPVSALPLRFEETGAFLGTLLEAA